MCALLRSSVVAGLLLLTPAIASAQVPFGTTAETQRGSLELTKPIFDGTGFGAATSVLRAALYIPQGDRGQIFVRLPVVFATLDGAGSSSTTLGNVELGITGTSQEGLPLGSVSAVIPTAQEFGSDDYATGVGIISDVLHADRYPPEVFSLNGNLTPSRRLDSGAIVGLDIGTSFWIPTDDGGDTEWIGRYGAFFVHESNTARVTADLAGFAILSEDGLGVGERTMHEIGVAAALVREGVDPELFVRVPLDGDVRDALTANVGIRLVF